MIKKLIKFIFVSIPIHIIMLFTSLLPNSKPSNKIRGFLLKPFFKKAGKNIQIASGVIINHPQNITIGNNVYIAHNCWINGTEKIVFEDNVIIGPYTVIATTEHKFIDGEVSNNYYEAKPIIIMRGSWLASHVIVTPGVKVGKGCLIGAGSVVTKDVIDNTMSGGVPAKNISKVNKFD